MQPALSGLIVLMMIFIEIAGFVLVGSRIGVAATLSLVLLSMLAGIYLLRRQGISILTRMQNGFMTGQMQNRAPDQEIAEGTMTVIGAILLIIPGFFSDLIGLMLFIPPVRRLLWHSFSKHIIINRSSYDRRRPKATKTIELDLDDYHANDPEKSPWRKP